MGNQLFIKNDVGKPKAEVLARRYRAAYSMQISHHTNKYIEKVEMLEELFNTKQQLLMNQGTDDYTLLPILIGAVDNHFTRKIFHEFFCKSENLLYIDVGNTATTVPDDWQQRKKSNWSAAELEEYNRSGYNGQVVVGLKRDGEEVLQPVAHLFPEILTSNDEIAPSQLSCSQLAKSEPQRVITNKFAALAVANYINEIFDEGTISHHLTLFHAKKSFMKAVPIKE
ncbi:hypothetical protein BAMA111019_15515 [Bacillus manliponensis]